MLVTIKGLQLSFNELFQAKQINGKGDAKFQFTGIINADTKVVVKKDDGTKMTKGADFLKEVCDKVFKEKFGKLDKVYKNWFYNKADGSTTREPYVNKETGEFHSGFNAETWFVSANTAEARADNGKLKLFDQAMNELNPGDKRLYRGCYVHALLDVFAYNDTQNGGGKGISAAILGVQLHKDGERLSAPPVDPGSYFDPEEVEEEEDAGDEPW